MQSEYPPEHVHHVWQSLKDEYEEMTKGLKENEEIFACFNGFDFYYTVQSIGYVGTNLLLVVMKLNSEIVKHYIHQSSLRVSFYLQTRNDSKPRGSVTFIQGK